MAVMWTFIAAALALGSAGMHAAAPDPLEAALLHAETALCAAFERGDAATLRRYMDPSFTLVNSRGEVSDYAQNVDEVARRSPRYETFRNHDQTVRRYGDTAIVIGITTVKGVADATPFAADFRYTDTWLRRDGAWKIAASHASRLADGVGDSH
jgi:ketosteroid isomerase-like protein